MYTLTGFRNSPDKGRALARDFRVRWTLEELGQPYQMKGVTFAELEEASYKSQHHPFGQIPSWTDGKIELFESGAIVLHLALKHDGLLPQDDRLRSRALAWLFAALDTVEPPIWDWDLARMTESNSPWYAQREPLLLARISKRLEDLSQWLGRSEWLDGPFTIGDLMMVTVLRRLQGSGILERHPIVASYVDRAEQRPAFCRAFAAQRLVRN